MAVKPFRLNDILGDKIVICKLEIAGVRIDIISIHKFRLNKRVECFAINSNREADLTIQLHRSTFTSLDQTVLLDDHLEWFADPNGKGSSFINIYDQLIDTVLYQLQVNKQWNKASITYSDSTSNMITAFTGPLGEILFRNRILFHQGMVVHSAAIEWEGRGIMFSAPSGTGKSTQAKLWSKFRGANILNEDRPAVKRVGDQAYVCGTIWNGSSRKYTNHRVPLTAIVLLEQAATNNIIRLDGREGISRLMPRCFLPYHDKELMGRAMDNLEGITKVTPVYLLKCRPDQEAVEMLYQCVK